MARKDEDGYVFRDRYPEREAVYAAFDRASETARRNLPCLLDLPYGVGPRERFDLFLGDAIGPLLVFVHGGYWQSLSKERYNFVARAFAQDGFSVALPNYPLAPAASIGEIVSAVRRGVPAMAHALHSAGYQPRCWIAAGHSAGGHLAAMLALTRWSEGVGLPPLAGCAPISGIFDLEPLTGTSLDTALRLDRDDVARLSPARLSRHGGRMVALVGSEETPAFLRQTAGYVAHWRVLGGEAEEVRLSNCNHYTILCNLLEERSVIVERITAMALGLQGVGRVVVKP